MLVYCDPASGVTDQLTGHDRVPFAAALP